jgi:hypothetical protein
MIYLFIIFFFITITGISAYFINKKYQQDKDNKQQEEQNIAISNLKSSLLAGSRIAKSNLNSSLEADSRVVESNLTASNVTNSLEAASNITSSLETASTIDASNLPGSLLGASTIDASNLHGSLLDASNLSASLLTASNVTGSLLAASKLQGYLAASNLDASNLDASNLAASNKAVSNLAASNLAASNKAVSNLAASNLTASNRAVSNLAASNLAASNLAASNLSGSLLTASNLAASNLPGSLLSASNLAASNLPGSLLAASNLPRSLLAASNLAASNLPGSLLAASTVTSSKYANMHVITVVGTGKAGQGLDTTGRIAISSPWGILFDNENNMYIGCTGSSNFGDLFQVSPDGIIIWLAIVPSSINSICWDKTSNYNTIIITTNDEAIYKYNKSDGISFIRILPNTARGGIDCDSNGNLYLSTPTGIYTCNVTTPSLLNIVTSSNNVSTLTGGFPIYIDKDNNIYFSQATSIVMLSSSGIWSIIYSTTNTNYRIGYITKSTDGTIYVQYNISASSGSINECCNIGIIESSTSIKYISGSNTTCTANPSSQLYAENSTNQENILASTVTFSRIRMIALDSNNNIYVTDSYNNRIRKIYNKLS